MESGVICLKPLYEYVLSTPNNIQKWDAENPWEKGAFWNNYKTCYTRLLPDARVPHKDGWYLWGCYATGIKTWKSIYAGVAGLSRGGTNVEKLDNRIMKELNAEREFLFIQRYSIQQIYRFKKETFPQTFPKFNKNADRAIRKMGATFILWVAVPESTSSNPQTLGKNLRLMESGLIEFFKPCANSDDARLPTPPNNMDADFLNICTEFERLIEQTKGEDYSPEFDFILSRLGGY